MVSKYWQQQIKQEREKKSQDNFEKLLKTAIQMGVRHPNPSEANCYRSHFSTWKELAEFVRQRGETANAADLKSAD